VCGAGEKTLAVGGMALQRYNSGMALKEVIALIDAEIAALKEARALLAVGLAVTVAKRKAGRPPKVQPDNTATPKRKKKRNLSPEGRARIAEAAKKRWAVAKKSRAKGGTGDGGYGITPKGGK
jgi:hypothetical protein